MEILSGPADGSLLDYGQASLRFRVQATDASGIQELSWAVDANGDGILGGIGRFERLATFVGGATDVTQELSVTPTFSGPGGDRVILIEAVDRTGNRTVVTRTLQLRDASSAGGLGDVAGGVLAGAGGRAVGGDRGGPGQSGRVHRVGGFRRERGWRGCRERAVDADRGFQPPVHA
ncbi:MAG: hypothetical protein V9G11_04780 [Bifidobacterium adolescentis]